MSEDYFPVKPGQTIRDYGRDAAAAHGKSELISEEKQASQEYKAAAKQNPKAAPVLRHIEKEEEHHARELKKANFDAVKELPTLSGNDPGTTRFNMYVRHENIQRRIKSAVAKVRPKKAVAPKDIAHGPHGQQQIKQGGRVVVQHDSEHLRLSGLTSSSKTPSGATRKRTKVRL